MNEIKVLMILTNFRKSNGVSSFAINYYRKLNHEQVHMDFAVYEVKDNPYEDMITTNGDRIILLPPIKQYNEHKAACEKLLKEGKYDIIHDNTLMLSYCLMKTAEKYVPVRILHSHNSKLGETRTKELRNKITLPILRSVATDYTACSELAAKAMFGNADYQFIPNVISCADFYFNEQTRNSVRKKLGVEDKFVIGTVGRPSPQKNPYFAIDVVRELAKTIPNIEYWWIGTGTLSQQVEKYIADNNLSDYIKLLGNRTDIPDLYQAMDCFFLPSLFEGLPVTAIEAQAMGLPCLISDTVTRELVYTDLVQYISLDNKEGWVQALQDVSKRKDRTGRSQDLLKSQFADVNAGRSLEEYYRSLIIKRGN